MNKYKIDYKTNPGRRVPNFFYASYESKKPVVSIITPLYNEQLEYFKDLTNSIFKQSFQQFEWIIVDDCSTECDAVNFIKQELVKDNRVKYVRHSVNKGVAAARNTGIKEAYADYIMFIDSDDAIETTALEKMLWRLLIDDDLMFCKGYSIGFGSQEYYWDHGLHDGAEILKQNNISTQGITIRKSFFSKTNAFFKEALKAGLEDWHFWLQCASNGYWGVTIPEALDWYRRKVGHETRWKNWKNIEKLHDQFKQEFHDLWEKDFPQVKSVPYKFGVLPAYLSGINLLKKNKKRLLMIVPWLVVGGADKFNLMAIKALKKAGWEITVVTTIPAANRWRSEFYELTSDVFILDHFLNPWDFPNFLRYLISSRDHDAIMVTNSEWGCRILPYLRHHFPHKAFVNYTHIEEPYWKNGGHPRLAVMYQHLFHSLYVASNHLKKWMIDQGADEQSIKTCYINVETDAWCPDLQARASERQKLKISDDTPVIVFAARMCAQKQPDVMIRTLELLESRHKHFFAIIAGDGEDLPRIKAYAKSKKLKNIYFAGQVSNEQVKRYMQASDIFFLPSLMEGISLAIYEAMSVGLAVVSADVGGQRELVTPEVGSLLGRCTIEEETNNYASTLESIIDNPNLLEKMRIAARNIVHSRFSLDKLGEHLDYLLCQDVEKARETGGQVDAFFAHNSALLAVDWFVSEQYTAGLAEQLKGKDGNE